jgi:hypothetical protein
VEEEDEEDDDNDGEQENEEDEDGGGEDDDDVEEGGKLDCGPFPGLYCLHSLKLYEQSWYQASPAVRGASNAPGTPRRQARSSQARDEDPNDKSFAREKVGSGRGGFSVKGAAAAAARARWAKVRREKAERGEDDDDDTDRKKRTTANTVKRESRAAADTYKRKWECGPLVSRLQITDKQSGRLWWSRV